MENRYRLEIESLDLGPDVRAVGLELINPETREPVTGSEAAGIWAAILPALAGEQPWAIDFFAHLERVRDFCRRMAIAFREPNLHAVVIPQPGREQLQPLFERFASETFGVRAGAPCSVVMPRSRAPWPNAGWTPIKQPSRNIYFALCAILRAGF
jgi:hypothetical protein